MIDRPASTFGRERVNAYSRAVTSRREGTGSLGFAVAPAGSSQRMARVGEDRRRQAPRPSAGHPISAGLANPEAPGMTAAASTPNHCSSKEQ